MEDREGLDKASAHESRVLPQGDTLRVADTKSLRDVWDNVKILLGLASWSQRYVDADRTLDASPHTWRVVGHSLGGAVALGLRATRPGLHLQSETCGRGPRVVSGWGQPTTSSLV